MAAFSSPSAVRAVKTQLTHHYAGPLVSGDTLDLPAPAVGNYRLRIATPDFTRASTPVANWIVDLYGVVDQQANLHDFLCRFAHAGYGASAAAVDLRWNVDDKNLVSTTGAATAVGAELVLSTATTRPYQFLLLKCIQSNAANNAATWLIDTWT